MQAEKYNLSLWLTNHVLLTSNTIQMCDFIQQLQYFMFFSNFFHPSQIRLHLWYDFLSLAEGKSYQRGTTLIDRLLNANNSIPFVKRKSTKPDVLPNIAPSKIRGPNGGTSFERVTDTLKNIKWPNKCSDEEFIKPESTFKNVNMSTLKKIYVMSNSSENIHSNSGKYAYKN